MLEWLKYVIVGVLLALQSCAMMAFAEGEIAPPLTSPAQLLTPEVILALVFLLTVPATEVFKRLFKTQELASAAANVVLNALTKGVLLVLTGQATLGFAALSVLLGIVLDKVFYDFITGRSREKVIAATAKLEGIQQGLGNRAA